MQRAFEAGMTSISILDLAAITGGNAAGNGQTGDRYRTNPNDNGSDPNTGSRWGAGEPTLGGVSWGGATAGRTLGTLAGGMPKLGALGR